MILVAAARQRFERRLLLDRLFGGGRGEEQLVQRRFVELGRRLGHVVEQRSAGQVGAHERRLAAQPRRDQAVGIFFAEQHQRPAEALDVRLVPGLARHEILGDEPRFGRLTALDVGVGQLRLRAEHRRLQPAVHADLDQMHEGGDVIGNTGHEFLEDRGRARPVDLRHRGLGGELDDEEAGFWRLLGDAPAQLRDPLAARRVLIEQVPDDRDPLLVLLAAKPDVGHREQQFGIVAGGFGGEVERRAGEIALGYEDSGELRGELGIARMGGRGLPQGVERVIGLAGAFQCRRDHPELLDGGRAFARLRIVAGGEVHVHQLFPDLVVVRVQLRGFAQHLDRLGWPPFSASSPAISLRSLRAPALSPISMRALAAVMRPS